MSWMHHATAKYPRKKWKTYRACGGRDISSIPDVPRLSPVAPEPAICKRDWSEFRYQNSSVCAHEKASSPRNLKSLSFHVAMWPTMTLDCLLWQWDLTIIFNSIFHWWVRRGPVPLPLLLLFFFMAWVPMGRAVKLKNTRIKGVVTHSTLQYQIFIKVAKTSAVQNETVLQYPETHDDMHLIFLESTTKPWTWLQFQMY